MAEENGVAFIVGPLFMYGSGLWREFVFDVALAVQLFAVLSKKTLGSEPLERLLSLGRTMS